MALLVVFSLLDLSWAGGSSLSLKEVWDAIWGHGTWAADIIVNGQNMPRIATGICVGAGLAVTGGVMQAVFRNPLATPYILGLSSGASLGAAVAILLSVTLLQPLLAFIFCFGTMLLVYTISRSGGSVVRTETLVLAGVAVSSLISAMVSFLTYIAPSEKMGSIVFWSLGSLSGTGWEDIALMAPVIAAGVVLMVTQSRNLNAMMLGDAHAMDLGVDVRRTRLLLLAVSSLVVAACVCFVGTIGFVGLVIPHIIRLLLGPDNRIILPLSAAGGATFVIMCDYIAHFVAPYYGVLPIGVVTSLIGAPFFIYLLCARKREVGW
ncbi:MAG: iron ABC transporter permease [Candidatus Methanomethylophilaceae archaeon]|nr:iron ABC transporter permease [Candidatus Methanomethylophilaceae archaeon]